jgi:hypothetical protein
MCQEKFTVKGFTSDRRDKGKNQEKIMGIGNFTGMVPEYALLQE